MSFESMAWAVKWKLPTKEKFILLLLANRSNEETGRCDPSIARLSEDTGMSKNSVIRAISNLESGGYLSVIRDKDGKVNMRNKYRLHVENKPPEDPKRGSATQALLVPNDAGGGACVAPGVVPVWDSKQEDQPVTDKHKEKNAQSGRPAANEARRDDQTKPSDPGKQKPTRSVKNVVVAYVDRPSDVSEQVWQDFLEVRKSKRLPMNETSLKGLVDEAQKAGVSLQDALTICCRQGWAGFGASWLDKHTQKPSASKHTGFQERKYVGTDTNAIGWLGSNAE